MSDQTAPISPDDAEVLWKHHNVDLKVLLRRNMDFIVYLDKNNEVHWQDTRQYEGKRAEAKIDVGPIQGRITCLEAIPTGHLSESIRRSIGCIMGEAMCLALDNRLKDAQSQLTKAEEFIVARNNEHARGWYAGASAIAAVIFVGLAFGAEHVYLGLYPDSADAKLNILAAGICGALGALFSILLRVGHAPLDSSAGPVIHYLEGAARITVGVIGAVIIVCAIRSDLLLPQLRNGYGLALACLVAGASERLASGIIERVEGTLANSTEKQKGKNKTA